MTAQQRRKATNITIDAEVLRKAKEMGINLSRTLEDRLVEIINEKRRQDWLKENKGAIEAYNERIEKYGSFGDRHRTW